MSLLHAVRHRLRTLLGQERYARELEEELQFHLSLDALQHGDDARFGARRRFGNMTSLTEETRRMAGLGFLDVARQDVRFALRTFRRTPGFTAVAVLTLAIGIGANTAIYSAVDAMLLRPLPYVEPDRLMKVSLTTPAFGGDPANDDRVWSYPKYVVFRDAQQLYGDVGLYGDWGATLLKDGEAERLSAEIATAGYLRTLGVRMQLGRNFAADEDRTPGGPHVVILSDGLWKRRFDADSSVIGKAARFSSGPYTVIGVLPPGFQGLSGQADVILPLMMQAARDLDQPWGHAYTLVGRLKPGITPAQAKEGMRQLGPRIDAAYPHPERHDWRWGATARELDATRVDPLIRRSLLVLLGAVGLVLLIGCANVANLFLVRAAGRRREIAVRLAVGASRGRLARQLLTESILLSALGGAAGLAVAWWGVKVLATLQPEQALRAQRLSSLGPVTFSSIHLDLSALGFAAALTVVTGILFGLVPALQATNPSLTGALKDDRVPPARRGIRGLTSRNVLVITEIALALVLLAGSGLMLRSLTKLLAVRPGFDAEHVLTLRIRPREGVARDSLTGFYDQVLARLAALPGVRSVGLSNCPPLNGGCSGTSIAFRDRPPVPSGTEPDVGIYWATSQWFSTMRVPLVRGRLFTSADRAGARKVVLVNQTAARTFWPGQDPIGRPVSLGVNDFWEDTAYVIGVVGDVRYRTVHRPPEPDVYLSYHQSPRAAMMLFVRTAGDPLSIAAPARQALRELAPTYPVNDVRPMTARVGDALSSARFSATLLGLFAFVALALATLGTYGVIAFAVAQRTREIGIRMALGATRRDVLRLVVGQGIALAAVGAALGIAGALAVTRVLGALLYDVTPSDPATLVGMALLLGAAVVIASWIPARRASRVHPADTLRAA